MTVLSYDMIAGHDPEPEICTHCGETCDEDGKCPENHTLWAGHAVDKGDVCLHDLHGHQYLAVRFSAGWMLLDETGKIDLNRACALIVEMWQDGGPWKENMS